MLDAIAKALCDLDIEYFSLHCYVPDASAGVSEVVVEVEEDDIVNVILTRTVDNGSVKYHVIERNWSEWPGTKDSLGEFDSLDEATHVLAARLANRWEELYDAE